MPLQRHGMVYWWMQCDPNAFEMGDNSVRNVRRAWETRYCRINSCWMTDQPVIGSVTKLLQVESHVFGLWPLPELEAPTSIVVAFRVVRVAPGLNFRSRGTTDWNSWVVQVNMKFYSKMAEMTQTPILFKRTWSVNESIIEVRAYWWLVITVYINADAKG